MRVIRGCGKHVIPLLLDIVLCRYRPILKFRHFAFFIIKKLLHVSYQIPNYLLLVFEAFVELQLGKTVSVTI